MDTTTEPFATVVFTCSRVDRAQLASRLFAQLADPRRAQASAQALDGCDRGPRADVLVAMTTHELPAASATLGRELWPMLDPLHTQGIGDPDLVERVRQHVADLVARRGWGPRSDGAALPPR